MSIKLTVLMIFSFLFAQVTCAMSEGAEIYLEAVEHSTSIAHDVSEASHDEVSEHQDELSGVSHCLHSHPPMTFIFNDKDMSFDMSEVSFIDVITPIHMSIVHRPPLSPPKA